LSVLEVLSDGDLLWLLGFEFEITLSLRRLLESGERRCLSNRVLKVLVASVLSLRSFNLNILLHCLVLAVATVRGLADFRVRRRFVALERALVGLGLRASDAAGARRTLVEGRVLKQVFAEALGLRGVEQRRDSCGGRRCCDIILEVCRERVDRDSALHGVEVAHHGVGVGTHATEADPVLQLHFTRHGKVLCNDIMPTARHAEDVALEEAHVLVRRELVAAVDARVELVLSIVQRHAISRHIVERVVDAIVDVKALQALLVLFADHTHHQREAERAEVASGLSNHLVPQRVVACRLQNLYEMLREFVSGETATDVHDFHCVTVLAGQHDETARLLYRPFEVFDCALECTAAVEVEALKLHTEIGDGSEAFRSLLVSADVVAKLVAEGHRGHLAVDRRDAPEDAHLRS
jgi:hypothetical protein